MEREGKEETPSKIYESLRSISKKDYQGFILKFNSISKNGFRKKAFLRIFITLNGIIILLSQLFGFVLIRNQIKYISNINYLRINKIFLKSVILKYNEISFKKNTFSRRFFY